MEVGASEGFSRPWSALSVTTMADSGTLLCLADWLAKDSDTVSGSGEGTSDALSVSPLEELWTLAVVACISSPTSGPSAASSRAGLGVCGGSKDMEVEVVDSEGEG